MGYDVGVISWYGHIINSKTQEYPDLNSDFCSRCGKPAISACPEKPIRGGHSAAGYYTYQRPAHCISCGKPYPWTVESLSAACELAAEMDELSEDDRKALAGTLDDLLTDSPRTQLAATRFQRLVAKAGGDAGSH